MMGFPEGHGRMIKLLEYLSQNNPAAFEGLSYSTVKGWFNDRAPGMTKIDDVFEALSHEYSIAGDQRLIKSWWKLGGFYPFTEDRVESGLSAKLQIQLGNIIAEALGSELHSASPDTIEGIQSEVVRIVTAFTDPDTTEPDLKTLSTIVQGVLATLRNDSF
ncbi:hypothetical protein DOK_11666 [gamma proteobacterium BDW918]|nr:hypothetical protein DOK_11666 [gamma proteobacterium BDW918]